MIGLIKSLLSLEQLLGLIFSLKMLEFFITILEHFHI